MKKHPKKNTHSKKRKKKQGSEIVGGHSATSRGFCAHRPN